MREDNQNPPSPAGGLTELQPPLPLTVAIGLGANLGNPAQAISEAVNRLREKGLRHIKTSSLYRTIPIDCKPGTPDFINAALTGIWPGPPPALLETCQEIEQEMGRPAEHAKDEARIIDLDLLIIKHCEINQAALKIPHPRLLQRLFVLIPLAEIAGEWMLNIDQTTQTLYAWANKLKRDHPEWQTTVQYHSRIPVN